MRRQEAARLETARLETARLEQMRRNELARQAQQRKSQAHDFWADGNNARRAERERAPARPAWSDSLSDEPVPRPLSRASRERSRRNPAMRMFALGGARPPGLSIPAAVSPQQALSTR